MHVRVSQSNVLGMLRLHFSVSLDGTALFKSALQRVVAARLTFCSALCASPTIQRTSNSVTFCTP